LRKTVTAQQKKKQNGKQNVHRPLRCRRGFFDRDISDNLFHGAKEKDLRCNGSRAVQRKRERGRSRSRSPSLSCL
jgi:hypothetical protein